MPSTWSLHFRLNLQAPGENLNVWGTNLNVQVFQLLEDAIAKRVAFSLSGSKTLTTNNGTADEARCAFLDVTSGAGGTITAPPLEKIYLVRNATSGDVIVTTGAGATATIVAGEITFVVSDGSNFRKVRATDFGGGRITGVGTPLNAGDAVPKSYADGLAFGAVNLPGQNPGTANFPLFSDGTVAGWRQIVVGDVDGAAPLAAPAFTGGVDVAGGLDVSGGLLIAGGAVQTGGSAAGVTAVAAVDLAFSLNDFQTKSINSNTAFTISGLQTGKAQVLVLVLTISSNAVPSFPSWVKFENGVNFLATLGNGTHWLTITTVDGGSSGVIKAFARSVA